MASMARWRPRSLAKQTILPCGSPLEQGLDLQHGPDGGFEIGQAAGPAEVAQVVDREDLRHAVPQRTQKGVGVVDAHPLAAAVDRAHDEQTLTERGAVGVNEQELARREFLAQLARGDLAGGVRSR